MNIGIKIQRQMKSELGVPTVAEIREMISTREDAQNRALVAIYNGQTETEKAAAVTVEDNGIGFSGVDAEILTSFAQQFLSRQWLSPKQRAILAKKLPKYAGQLWQIAITKKRGAVTVTAKADPAVEQVKDELAEVEREMNELCAKYDAVCDVRLPMSRQTGEAAELARKIADLSVAYNRLHEKAYA